MATKLEELEKQSDDGTAFEGLANEVPKEKWEQAAKEFSHTATITPTENAPAPAPAPDEKPPEQVTVPGDKKPVGTAPAPEKTPEPDDLEKQFAQIEEDSKEAHPNVKKGISLAREIANQERKARQEFEVAKKEALDRVADLEKKLLNPQMPEKEGKELEELRQLRREVDIENDPQFRVKYIDQLQSMETSIMDTLKQVGLKDEILQWIASRGGILTMVTSTRPVDKETTDAQWVEDKLLARAPAFYRDRIKSKLNQAYDLNEDMQKEMKSVASTAKERGEQKAAQLKIDFEAGIKEEMEVLGDSVKKLDTPTTASPEERERIKRHNARVEKATAAFNQFLKDGQNQKTAAKLLVRAAHSQFLEDAIAERDETIKALEGKLEKIKSAGSTSSLGTPTTETKNQQPEQKKLMTETDDQAVERLMKP